MLIKKITEEYVLDIINATMFIKKDKTELRVISNNACTILHIFENN